ncbi:MAG: tRNA pseudouridine(38-40) synthase TruA [Woeseiaceae bacterium]
MPRVALLVEYSGTRYCGWQRQKHCQSVQEWVEKALSRVANEPVVVQCAGRTDSGVHASGQVVHFDTDADRDARSWTLGANSHLPSDISVRAATVPHPEFHARFDAIERHYRYIIVNTPSRYALFADRAMTVHEPLDAGVMQQAANSLLGKHDFSAFRAAGCQAKHANRDVRSLRIQRHGQWILVDIAANAFLHHMVRNIVGLLIAIGTGLRPVSFAAEILAKRQRKLAPSMAAAEGLYLTRVLYPPISKLSWQNDASSNFKDFFSMIPADPDVSGGDDQT